MKIVLQPEDVTIDDVSAHANDWHANYARVFRVTYRNTGRGIDLKSVLGPRPAACHILGIAPWDLLLAQICRIPNVCKATIDESEPNLLIVETLHRNGRDWEAVRPQVNAAIIQHLTPSKRPPFFARFRRQKTEAIPR